MFDVVLELDVGLCMCTRTSNLFDLRFGAVTTRGWILHRSMVQQLCPKMLLWTRRESSPTRPPIFHYGYHHWATTTMYGDAPRAACGGIDTHRLVAGTRYHSVASAQSMWRNCNGNGACWCGSPGGGSGTTGMGCLSCAKGRFLYSGYGQKGKALYSLAETESEEESGADTESPFMSEEIIVVVGDLCPHPGNEDWCPSQAGHRNAYGSFNHLDFSHYPDSVPHSRSIPNKNFVFSRIECPGDLKQRYYSMSQCRWAEVCESSKGGSLGTPDVHSCPSGCSPTL